MQVVVVGKPDNDKIDGKKPLDITIGVFFDGTLNNMYNTLIRQIAKSPITGDEKRRLLEKEHINTSVNEAWDIAQKMGKEGSSYENDLSNPARLFRAYNTDDTPNSPILKVYVEGIGTKTHPKIGEKELYKDYFIEDDSFKGPAIGEGTTGIISKVNKGIEQILVEIRNVIDDDYYLNTITFDVFGFSRGAAAARHFVYKVTRSAYRLRAKPVEREYGTISYDLYDPNGNLVRTIKGKYGVNIDISKHLDMPRYGYLGELLKKENILNEHTKVKVRFLGIYDTVPHHGLVQWNDIKDLHLDEIGKADYIVHMVAKDEHRFNFDLADIKPLTANSNKAIEIYYPGVHSDVGGSYEDNRIEEVTIFKKSYIHNDKNIFKNKVLQEVNQLKAYLMYQGWYTDKELQIKGGKSSFSLIGTRNNISKQYSFIPLLLMAEFCNIKNVPINRDENKYVKGYTFTDDKNQTYSPELLKNIKNLLWDYTFKNGEKLKLKETHFGTIYSSDLTIAEKQKAIEEQESREGLLSYNKNIRILRNRLLHWNSNIDDWVNKPNNEHRVRTIIKR